MLKSLYTINAIKEEGDQILASVSLNENSVIYQAHFPSEPITPGVCQVHLIQDVLQSCYPARIFKLRKAKYLKFTKVLKPTEYKDVELKIELTKEENTWMINTQLFYKSTYFLKAKLFYEVN